MHPSYSFKASLLSECLLREEGKTPTRYQQKPSPSPAPSFPLQQTSPEQGQQGAPQPGLEGRALSGKPVLFRLPVLKVCADEKSDPHPVMAEQEVS